MRTHDVKNGVSILCIVLTACFGVAANMMLTLLSSWHDSTDNWHDSTSIHVECHAFQYLWKTRAPVSARAPASRWAQCVFMAPSCERWAPVLTLPLQSRYSHGNGLVLTLPLQSRCSHGNGLVEILYTCNSTPANALATVAYGDHAQ